MDKAVEQMEAHEAARAKPPTDLGDLEKAAVALKKLNADGGYSGMVDQLEQQLAAARRPKRDAKPPTVQLQKLYDSRSPLQPKLKKQVDYGKELEAAVSS